MKNQEESLLTPLQIADCKTGRIWGRIRRPKGAGSRVRIKRMSGDACYHVMSRTAGGEFLFDDQAKEAFRRMMWRMATFAGVEVLTYCVMDNHFHILVRVPDRVQWLRRFAGDGGEEKLLKHLGSVYSKAFMAQLRGEIAELRESGNQQAIDQLLDGFKARLCDVSKFVKELKERFSRWYNKTYGRRGTLWMDRFKSVLVQGPGKVSDPLDVENAALMIANYIDLNPIRAGICDDPKDYRFCGYAEAVAGSKRARRGLCKVMSIPIDDWLESTKGRQAGGHYYRMLLFGKAVERRSESDGAVTRKGVSRDAALKVVENGGKLDRADLLRCRVRYFTDGAVIGSKNFVNGWFAGVKESWKTQRVTGARMVSESKAGLYAFRKLRVRVLE